MKKLTLIIFLVLLLTACATPQAGAETKVPTTLTAPMSAHSSLPEMPVSDPGLAPQDTPSAVNSPQQPGILSILRVQMIDSNAGWAEGGVSSDGMPNPNVNSDARFYLLHTMDGGETWQDVTPPTPFGSSQGYGEGIGLSAIDANTAWAISSGYPFSDNPPYTIVWRTTDGGQSWSPGNPISTVSGAPDMQFSPWLQFVDENHGWLTLHFQQRIQSYDAQFRTSDGGITWEQMSGCSTSDGYGPGCDVPQFTDSQTGWLRSPPDYTPNGEVDSSSIWRVQRTLDGGQSWQNISLPHSRDEAGCYQSFTRVGAGMVGIRVDCSTSAGLTESYYYLSADRGQTWHSIPLPGTAFSLIPPTQAYETAYLAVSTTGNAFFLDMTTGWRLSVVDNGYQLEQTTDGGATWQKQSDHLSWKENFQFVDANLGWEVIIDFSDHPRMELQRTTDGGKTWNKLTPRLLPDGSEKPAIARLETGYSPVFKSIQMIDSLKGWATAANGYVFHTTNGGKDWQDVTPRYGDILAHREFFALDARRAWTTVFSSYGTIWYTTDGGQSWRPTSTLSEMDGQYLSPTNIQFLNENTGWFQWNDNSQQFHLMKTKDNGTTWETQTTGQNPSYYTDPIGFVFLDEKNGFKTEPIAEHTLEELLNGGAVLTISKTADGGNTWQPITLPEMILDPAEISLDEITSSGTVVYPDGVKGLMKETFSCNQNSLQIFGPDSIGLKVICEGASREGKPVGAADTVYNFKMVENYLSADAGKSWNNWMSIGYDTYSYSWTFRDPFESMFFIANGTGWRMDSGDRNRSGRLQHTVDGGKNWTVIKTVSWDKAQFDFVNEQEGWALATNRDAVSLVHTTDGGQTWEELKPVVTNP